jgi:hypothetical protein
VWSLLPEGTAFFAEKEYFGQFCEKGHYKWKFTKKNLQSTKMEFEGHQGKRAQWQLPTLLQ